MWSSTKSYFAVSGNLWKSSSSASHRILKTKTSLWSITRCVFFEVAQNTGNNIRYTRKRKDGTTARTKIWIALERFLCNKLRHLGCDWRTLVKMNGDSVILFVTTPTRHDPFHLWGRRDFIELHLAFASLPIVKALASTHVEQGPNLFFFLFFLRSYEGLTLYQNDSCGNL